MSSLPFPRFSIVLLAAVIIGLSPVAARADDTTPPTIAIATSQALTTPQSIAFNEDVRNVTSSNVVLRLAGSTQNLAARLVCLATDATRVDCAGGPLRRATLTALAALIPGQRYDLLADPLGVDPVTDVSGNAAPTMSSSFIASTTEQESSAAAIYVWPVINARGAIGGSYHAERAAGAIARFVFHATSVTWFAVNGPTHGWAVVGIDGAEVARINEYAKTVRYQVARRTTGLSDATHVLTVRVLGQTGRPGGGASVAVDSFRAGSGPDVDGTYAWPVVTKTRSLGSAYARTATAGARVAFRFRARAIGWYTITGPDQGKASVYVDRTLKATFDNYAPSTRFGVRRVITGLTDAVHSLTIVVTGAHHAGARGSSIVVDAWSLKAPVVAFGGLGTWIDLFDFSGSTDPSAMLDAMKKHGVRTLYLETSRYNSTSSFGTDSGDESAAIGRWVDGAHARGIKVIGWYFPAYSEFMETDVKRTVAIATFRSSGGHSFDGLAIDIEYKGKNSSLQEFNDGVRTHLHRVRLSVGSVYPIAAITPAPVAMAIRPSSWTGFPWAAIGAEADVVMPMGYWSYRRSSPSQCPGDAATYCAYGYTKGNIEQARTLTKLPVHEIGGLEQYTLSGKTHTIPDADVTDFVRGSEEARAYGASFYDYRTTRPGWWTTLARLNP